MDENRRRGRVRGGRKKGKHFMDVVLEAYVRDITLNSWRELDDLVSLKGLSLAEALTQHSAIPFRGAYTPLWENHWKAQVLSLSDPALDTVIGDIEPAFRAALLEEIALRREQGAVDIEDTPHYLTFVARAMNNLLEDAEGEIEDF